MKTITTLTAAATIAMTGFAFAASDGGTSSTNTTKDCKNGKVWDDKKNKCVDAEHGMFSDDKLYETAKEFAYAGQYDNAINVLKLAANQDDPRIGTYYGFAHRKAGRVELGMSYYEDVLAKHPNYLLARSYMGQALMLQGDGVGALNQLKEIAARGGKGTEAYTQLAAAISGSPLNSY